jgi:hypothetical protein
MDNDAFPDPVEEASGEAQTVEINRKDRTSKVLNFIAVPLCPENQALIQAS